MTTATQIMNRAMRLLKAQTIASRTDGTKNGNVVNDVYDHVVDDLLRSHKWHFARKLVELSKEGSSKTTFTRVWQVVDATSTFVDETTDANDDGDGDWTVFPASEVIGDYVAFGMDGRVAQITFDYANGTAGVGGVVTWEYWNGSAWKGLSDVNDKTNGFTTAVADGLTVSWTVPTNWQKTTLNFTEELYYVRASITTVYSTNPVLDQAAVLDTSPAPGYEFDYAYALPDDWIRTVRVCDNDAGVGTVSYREAEVRNVGVLLASTEKLYLEYVYKVTDPDRMPTDFETALAFELAVQMPGISNLSAAAWESLEAMAKRRYIRAKSADALGSPPPQRPMGSWAAARQGWPSNRWPR
jgi:hypothetical protein